MILENGLTDLIGVSLYVLYYIYLLSFSNMWLYFCYILTAYLYNVSLFL